MESIKNDKYTLKNVTLYSWQEECLKRWAERGCRGIVGVATGAGKTMLALAAVCLLAARPGTGALKVKIIVPKVFLAGQWRADLMNFLGLTRDEIGLFYGELKENSAKPFMIYVLNTARGCVSRHIMEDVKSGASVLLVCDECHHFGSSENAHVFDFLPHIPPERYFTLGLSATPRGERYDEIVVPALGREFYQYNLLDTGRDRVTADYTVFNIGVDLTPEEGEEYEEFSDKILYLKIKLRNACPSLKKVEGLAFVRKLRQLLNQTDQVGDMARMLWLFYLKRKEIVHMAQARPACGLELIRLLPPDCRIILFTERIAAAEDIYGRLRRLYPGKVCRYHSDMDPQVKRRALESYRQGENRIIVCCRALDEGLNVPETDAGIFLSGGSGSRQRIQRVGRVIRRGNGLRSKYIYYLYARSTVELPSVLPKDAVSGRIHNLFYDAGADCLRYPDYDAPAERVMTKLAASGASWRRLLNAEEQIARGRVRGDFLLSEKACLQRVRQAKPEERDYWIAMLLMARAVSDLPGIRSDD
jgi:superfamily II DNA or RNA helicase